jgi:hypothetical protein
VTPAATLCSSPLSVADLKGIGIVGNLTIATEGVVEPKEVEVMLDDFLLEAKYGEAEIELAEGKMYNQIMPDSDEGEVVIIVRNIGQTATDPTLN